jgi:MFS family permease
MEDFLHRWPITPWQKGVMSMFAFFRAVNYLLRVHGAAAAAALELGSLFGAILAGVLADRHSRQHSIFLACGACF